MKKNTCAEQKELLFLLVDKHNFKKNQTKQNQPTKQKKPKKTPKLKKE